MDELIKNMENIFKNNKYCLISANKLSQVFKAKNDKDFIKGLFKLRNEYSMDYVAIIGDNTLPTLFRFWKVDRTIRQIEYKENN